MKKSEAASMPRFLTVKQTNYLESLLERTVRMKKPWHRKETVVPEDVEHAMAIVDDWKKKKSEADEAANAALNVAERRAKEAILRGSDFDEALRLVNEIAATDY